jgi:MFS family permease
MADPPAPSHVLRSPSFRFLLGSSVASSVGGAISGVSVNWLVYHYTGSTLDVAYVGLTGIVPAIALGLFAGVLADRYDRRQLMITADLVRMVVMAILAAALFLTGFSLFLILAVMAVVYSFTAVFTPASQAIIPRIVPTGQLEDANGLLSALASTGSSIGAAAGGLAIVFFGAVAGVGINAATFALSALLLFQVAASAGRNLVATSPSARSLRKDLAEGIAYMRAHLPILEVTLGFLPGNFLFTMVISFFVVYATIVYPGDAAAFGYLVASFAAGGVVGAITVGRIRGRRFAGLLMGVGVVIQGGMTTLLVVGRWLPISLAGAVGLGVCVGLINTVYYSTMQAIVPNEVLARVLSIDSVGAFGAIPAGLVVGGFLAASHGILFVYSIAAVGIFVNGLVLLALPGVRSLRYGA